MTERDPLRIIVPVQIRPLLDEERRAAHFAKKEGRIIARFPNSERAKRARAKQEAERDRSV